MSGSQPVGKTPQAEVLRITQEVHKFKQYISLGYQAADVLLTERRVQLNTLCDDIALLEAALAEVRSQRNRKDADLQSERELRVQLQRDLAILRAAVAHRQPTPTPPRQKQAGREERERIMNKYLNPAQLGICLLLSLLAGLVFDWAPIGGWWTGVISWNGLAGGVLITLTLVAFVVIMWKTSSRDAVWRPLPSHGVPPALQADLTAAKNQAKRCKDAVEGDPDAVPPIVGEKEKVAEAARDVRRKKIVYTAALARLEELHRDGCTVAYTALRAGLDPVVARVNVAARAAPAAAPTAAKDEVVTIERLVTRQQTDEAACEAQRLLVNAAAAELQHAQEAWKDAVEDLATAELAKQNADHALAQAKAALASAGTGWHAQQIRQALAILFLTVFLLDIVNICQVIGNHVALQFGRFGFLSSAHAPKTPEKDRDLYFSDSPAYRLKRVEVEASKGGKRIIRIYATCADGKANDVEVEPVWQIDEPEEKSKK